MIQVEFLGPIDKKPIQVEANNLEELSLLLKKDSSILPWLENSAVALNDKLIKDINTPLKNGDKVSILPPVCGG